MDHFPFKYVILLYLIFSVYSDEYCPKKCTCKRTSPKGGPNWAKLRCGDTTKLNSLDDLDLVHIADEITQLNLSNNYILMFAPKIQFLALEKLDLSKNKLSILYDNQFSEVPNLRRLDVSGNAIKHIEVIAFIGLQHLQRLKLNQNQVSTITKGTFKPLNSLKQLDISNNPLTCDCDLLWLLEWTQKTSVKLLSNPRCSSPQTFKGAALKKIKIGIEIHCKSPAGNRKTPSIDLQPNQNQVVFEGDAFRINCKAPSIGDLLDPTELPTSVGLKWSWLDLDPKHYFENISIQNRYIADSSLIDSTLFIAALNRNHTGIWNCLLISDQGNFSKGITIVVISDDTEYCPLTLTTNNKGSYTWPRTVVNYTASIPCESFSLNEDLAHQKATYFCSESGEWENFNTSMCSYMSETTKILEQFSKVNLTLTKGSVYESARHFKNFTADLHILKDVMDLVYIVRTIENYLQLLITDKELGTILMDISNSLMKLSKSYLITARRVDNSSVKIVKSLERIASFTPSPLLHKSHIALEEFPVKLDKFAGMTCSWYTRPLNTSDRLFYCVTSNRSGVHSTQDRVIKASIRIPASLFHQLQEQGVILGPNSNRISVAMFDNNNFFPVENDKYDILSAVVGVRLVNVSTINLTEPVYIMLKSPPLTYQTEPLIPVWWDMTDGKGNWSSEGCQLNHELQDNVVFHCNHLGYYGLLQKIENFKTQTSAKFKLSHPAIYVGSFILFVTLLIVIINYLLYYPSIQMPKNTKHSLINTWIAVEFLCFMYVFGIYQIEDVQVCQAIGISLHYFTLSALLWMCVSVSNMYKRLRKNDAIELQDDELPSEQPIQKPILGLYLVGWGIALLVCGISGAVNMKEYASPTHCFLNNAPALSALFVPLLILLFILISFVLLIRCSIYNVDTNGHLSEGTQATENVDLDLLEPSFPDRNSINSASMKTSSSEIEDSEHAPIVQLKAHAIFLIVYLLAWASAALAVVQPFKFIFEETVFSIVYAILSTVLSIFALFFYCVARNDVRTQWVTIRSWFRRRGVCFRSRNVSDAAQNLPQVQSLPLPTQIDVHVTSRSSSRSSTQTKSNSHNSNAFKAAVDLNTVATHEPPGAKINNVNLVVLHRQQYRVNNVIPNLIENPTSSAELFYNPYQSTVARKFFKKQKRHLKRNNLTAHKCDITSDNTSIISSPNHPKMNCDKNIFVTNSKVNNTNIHIEHVRKTRQHNLNILSDSCEDVADDVEKLMLNAERLRNRQRNKKKQNNVSSKEAIPETNMRTISQQCSLEYSSETTSDLEKIKDEPPPTENPDLIFNNPINPFYQPSDVSSYVTESANEISVPRIYVNPSHDLVFLKRVQSRASSVSTSELDELYQQIRKGPKLKPRRSMDDSNIGFKYLPSEMNFDDGCKKRASSVGDVSEYVETTV